MKELVRVTVAVKALNEAPRIEACLLSAWAALDEVGGGQLVLADSGSTDGTVELARAMGVAVVSFVDPARANCGAAAQLAYQAADGDFFYLLDGDMELQPGFLPQALSLLQTRPELAGVGGLLLDKRVRNAADRRRQGPVGTGTVRSLGGGGLYRRAAVASVGYMGHRGLAACEESELGQRLRHQGWLLWRLAVPAVSHEGHAEGSWRRLLRLWRGGRLQAYGVYLRSAWRKPWRCEALYELWYVWPAPLVHAGALVAAALGGLAGRAPLVVWALAEGVAWLVVIGWGVRRGDPLMDALVRVLEWHMNALGTMVGALRTPVDPTQPLAMKIETPQGSSSATAPRAGGRVSPG